MLKIHDIRGLIPYYCDDEKFSFKVSKGAIYFGEKYSYSVCIDEDKKIDLNHNGFYGLDVGTPNPNKIYKILLIWDPIFDSEPSLICAEDGVSPVLPYPDQIYYIIGYVRTDENSEIIKFLVHE